MSKKQEIRHLRTMLKAAAEQIRLQERLFTALATDAAETAKRLQGNLRELSALIDKRYPGAVDVKEAVGRITRNI